MLNVIPLAAIAFTPGMLVGKARALEQRPNRTTGALPTADIRQPRIEASRRRPVASQIRTIIIPTLSIFGPPGRRRDLGHKLQIRGSHARVGNVLIPIRADGLRAGGCMLCAEDARPIEVLQRKCPPLCRRCAADGLDESPAQGPPAGGPASDPRPERTARPAHARAVSFVFHAEVPAPGWLGLPGTGSRCAWHGRIPVSAM